MLPKFTIDARPGHTLVTVDDKPIGGVSAVQLVARPGEIPTLTVAIDADGTVSGQGNVDYETVNISDRIRELDPGQIRDMVEGDDLDMAQDPYALMLMVVADLIDEALA